MRFLKDFLLLTGLMLATCAYANGNDIAAHTEIIPISSMTLTDQQMLSGDDRGKPVTIAGVLRLASGNQRQPVVMLIHGSSGVGPNIEMWERKFNALGIATFALDGFSGRNIMSTSRDQSQLGRLNLILDAYRALGELVKNPRVDPSKVFLMGFSRGGQATLYASLTRLQRMWNTSGATFAAYIPFYPDCMTSFKDDTNVAGPIREFHGAADDYDPPAACAAYFRRLQAAGRDAQMTIFAGANHAFDMPTPMPIVVAKGAQTVRACKILENDRHQLINADTDRPFSFDDDCVQFDPHVGADPVARDTAIREVTNYVQSMIIR
ncbi:dienelactone hydrolase [Paraburkholderia tropica]|uniref:dienelactone hydrolase family protein n=1 Tax=Paraburkholderia tropica TaxID=92647 RepID=UPI0017F99C79|nr:dienelactone hydrolase family protein [Paraburkholderia tropica]MBB3003988.1 dienelactone hydrolase [Paraburkholderia tropica]MBB6323416.1 dienelactone hydrolase [Paraburkholderia tropica]